MCFRARESRQQPAVLSTPLREVSFVMSRKKPQNKVVANLIGFNVINEGHLLKNHDWEPPTKRYLWGRISDFEPASSTSVEAISAIRRN